MSPFSIFHINRCLLLLAKLWVCIMQTHKHIHLNKKKFPSEYFSSFPFLPAEILAFILSARPIKVLIYLLFPQ